MQIDHSKQETFANLTFQINAPDGVMFVSVLENEAGKPCAIDISVGKAGGALRAWAHCFARMVTMGLEHGVTLEELIEELSSQTTDQTRMSLSGMKCRSGPEAVYIALMEYRRDKFDQTRKLLGMSDGDEHARRGSRLGRRKVKAQR